MHYAKRSSAQGARRCFHAMRIALCAALSLSFSPSLLRPRLLGTHARVRAQKQTRGAPTRAQAQTHSAFSRSEGEGEGGRGRWRGREREGGREGGRVRGRAREGGEGRGGGGEEGRERGRELRKMGGASSTPRRVNSSSDNNGKLALITLKIREGGTDRVVE